ncbi:MAG: tetratricopeptide repeat protein, partial [Planctomycetota bacterium]
MEYYISILVFTFGIITWIPFLKTPYGQDQAGAAYYVDQVIKGKLALYKDVFVYPIGNYYHLIIIQYLFGKENKYFNRFMCLWCSLSACTIYWIVYDVFGLTSAIIAGILYALYIVNPRIGGNFGANEAVLALPLLVSLFLVLKTSNSDSYFLIALSGLFFGYAILIRQTVILYLPGYFLMIMGMNIPFTYCFIFGGSVLISNLIPLIYYWTKDAFWEYLAANWLVMLPSAINPKKYNKYYPKIFVRGEVGNKLNKQVLLRNSLSTFPLMFLTIISLISVIINYDHPLFHLGLFICLLSSIWMIFMRGTLFPHYWQYMIPWLVILSSNSFVETMSIFSIGATLNTFQLSIVLILFGMFIYTICIDYRFYIPHKDPYGYLRKFYGDNFVNSNYINHIKIAEYIKHTTKPEDKILVCGWAPYIILYSERSSFTPDICMYAEDYLEIYNKTNPALLDFINSIYNFRNFTLIKKKKNLFKSNFPETIVFSDGKGDIKDFERLTNMCYSMDETLGGFPLYRVDVELTGLMRLYETDTQTQKTMDTYSPGEMLSEDNYTMNWDENLKVVKQILTKDPYSIESLLVLGDFLISADKHKLLFSFYKRLMESKLVTSASMLRLLNKLGEAHCDQGKYKEAKETFLNILNINPDNPTVLNNLGVVYTSLNDN